MAIWRIKAVKNELGLASDTSVYVGVRGGLLTRGVAIGQRAKGWPDYEIRAIASARIAGKADDQIKELVNRLHANRLVETNTTIPQ
jgi:prophage regulatory protein